MVLIWVVALLVLKFPTTTGPSIATAVLVVLIFENRYDVPAPVLVNPPEAVNGNPVPRAMLVPKIKFPEALTVAEPPTVVVPIITVLIDVMVKLFEEDNESVSIMFTRPPKIVIAPARLTGLFSEIFPELLAAPIVSPLPEAPEVMA